MWLLERNFWLFASDTTVFLNAVYYLFPPLATLLFWRKDGVFQFKLLFFYSLGGWFWTGLMLNQWLRDKWAVHPPNYGGWGLPGGQETFFVVFFGFLYSFLYYTAWQAVLLFPRELVRAWQRERNSPWRRLQHSAERRRKAGSAGASPSR